MLKKLRWYIIGYIALLFLAGVLLFQMCTSTNQAAPAFVLETEFVGEYRLGESEWQQLEKNTRFSAFDDDLVLRGRFKDQLPLCVSFYLNHIGVTVSVNGEEVFCSGRTGDDVPEMMCGSYWSSWFSEELSEDDEIEIRLHNPHQYGNAGAYNQFLKSLHFGGDKTLQEHLNQESLPYQIAGIFILVVSVALLGMALGYLAHRIPSGSLLWSMGILSLFMGGYILMDTVDICFHSNLIVFNTCVRQCCIMFGSLELTDCIRKTLTEGRRKIAEYLMLGQGTVTGILFLLSIVGVVAFYDTGPYWAVIQGGIIFVLFGLCVLEYRQHTKTDRVLLDSYIILLVAGLFELVNARIGFGIGGIALKVVFILLFVFQLVRAVKMIAVNHQASIKAKRLEEELKNSRIVLAMSQIQPHFMYNALAAIRSLCVEDSRKAVEAIDKFSGYLRGSLETMDKKQCISFQKEMEFVDNYLYLEQQRFENKIKVEKEIKAENFMLPPMSVQPIVENAIRHGIRKKRTAGSVAIKSFEDEKGYIVIIADDGVGFDVTGQKDDGKVHVGLQNVEKRLQLMCNGSLEVESVPGQGTTVTIRIPKNVKKNGREKGQKER